MRNIEMTGMCYLIYVFFNFFSCASDHVVIFFFFSSRRRHTRWPRDWSSDVCSSDLPAFEASGPRDYRTDRRIGPQTRGMLYSPTAAVLPVASPATGGGVEAGRC